MYYKTQGIILKRRDYREVDGLFSIYTKDRGKIEVVAKGVKKIKSKLSSHLDYFSLVDLMIAKGRNFDQIAGATMTRNFSSLKSDLGKIILGSYCFEVVDALIKTEYRDERIWKLLNEALELLEITDYSNVILDKAKQSLSGLNKRLPCQPLIRRLPRHDSLVGLAEKSEQLIMNSKQLKSLIRIFSLKLLSYLGYTPELYNCVICKSKIIPEGNVFSVKRGGLVCGKCERFHWLEDMEISPNTIKVLRLMLKENLGKFMKLKMSSNLFKEINKIINFFLAIHLEKEIKSERWLVGD